MIGNDYVEKCNPHNFCEANNQISWTIDYESPMTLKNWMTSYPELICSSPFYIGLAGMMYFTGFAIGSAILPTLGDKYGLKLIWLSSHLAYFVAWLPIVFMPIGSLSFYNYIIALFSVLGFTGAGRFSLGFVYATEMVPREYHSMVGSAINAFDGLMFFWFTLYYISMSPEISFICRSLASAYL